MASLSFQDIYLLLSSQPRNLSRGREVGATAKTGAPRDQGLEARLEPRCLSGRAGKPRREAKRSAPVQSSLPQCSVALSSLRARAQRRPPPLRAGAARAPCSAPGGPFPSPCSARPPALDASCRAAHGHVPHRERHRGSLAHGSCLILNFQTHELILALR